MKVVGKRKSALVYLLVALMAGLCVLAVGLSLNSGAVAEDVPSVVGIDELNFTTITNSDGEESYKVALKPTSRPTAQIVIVPQEYNGLPVTQIADAAFQSCTKLQKVILPLSIESIGMNAFINCGKLEKVVIPPKVKSIGNNAFGMCVTLSNLYIPESVETVGATILRNNAQPIYIQASEPGENWNANWKSYHTGELYSDITPDYFAEYEEILNEAEEVVGYQLKSVPYGGDGENIIYSSFSPDPENIEYKPVLNIAPNAFSYISAGSVTIKHRDADDPDAPVFNHAINICSRAFANAFIADSINLEVETTFNHPVDYTYDSMYEIGITGDENGRAKEVFADAYNKSLTLYNLDYITESMFARCTELVEIKLVGEDYNGENHLPNEVSGIDSFAFDACISMENIFIPSNTILNGENIFNGWGVGNVHEIQRIDFDIYEDEITDWNTNWDGGIQYDKIEITFKQPIEITLHLQDGTDATQAVFVKPGNALPQTEPPVRSGFEFLGYYSEPDGQGIQYYTNTMESVQVWENGAPTDLYANWKQMTFTVQFNANGGYGTLSHTENYDTLLALPNGWELTRTGYYIEKWQTQKGTFSYGVGTSAAGTQYAIGAVDKIQNFGEVLYAVWKPVKYTIRLNANNGSGLTEDIAMTYDVGTYLPNPFQYTGYSLEGWATYSSGSATYNDGAYVNNLAWGQNNVVNLYAKWSANTYTIRLDAQGGYEGAESVSVKYNALMPAVQAPKQLGFNFEGYFTSTNGNGTKYYSSDMSSSVRYTSLQVTTLYAHWTPQDFDDTYMLGSYNVYCYEQLIQLRDRANEDPNKYLGKTVNLRADINLQNRTWTPIDDTIFNFYGNGHTISNLSIYQTKKGSGYVGFFGLFTDPRAGYMSYAHIMNLNFRNVTITVTADVHVAAIAGRTMGKIINCNVDNLKINAHSSYAEAGGIASYLSYTKISNCTVTNATIDCYGVSGGIVASWNGGAEGNFGGPMTECSFNGTISAYMNSNVGGIAGVARAEIENCSVSGSIVYRSPKQEGEINFHIKPYIGTIIGTNYSKYNGCNSRLKIMVPIDSLVVYSTGSLWWKETNDQTEYVGGYADKYVDGSYYICTGEVGRIKAG